MVAQRLCNRLALELYLLLKLDVVRRSTHLYDEGAWLDVPFAYISLMAVETKLLYIETGGDSLLLSWFQRYAGKALQLNRTDVLTLGCG